MCHIPKVPFSIYKLADVQADGSYRWMEEIKEDVSHIDMEAGTAALTVLGYVKSNGMKAWRQGDTDENGQLIFKDLEDGIYLIDSQIVTYQGKRYESLPILVQLPSYQDGKSVSRVTVHHDKDTLVDENNISVLKKWENVSKENRPNEVKVLLWNGEELVDSVLLSEKTGWAYQWEGLDPAGDWLVMEAEESRADYQVGVWVEGRKTVITNTKKTDPSTEHTWPNKKDTSNFVGKLPKTGQLWWPVSVLSCLGIVCVLIGRRLRS